MLQQYRADMPSVSWNRRGLGSGRMRGCNFRAPSSRQLDDAIAQQQKIVDQARERTAASQQAWIAERNRVKAFDTLSVRRQQEQVRKEARQEQRATDEHSAKLFRDRREGVKRMARSLH